MNRRDLFKGIGAMVGGLVAAKAGIPAAVRNMRGRLMPSIHEAMHGEPFGDGGFLIPESHPIFDLIDTGELTEEGYRIRVPRLRGGAKATFIGEEDEIL